MNRIPIIACIALAGITGLVEAAPRIALVRVKEIYTELPATQAMTQQLKAEREQIGNDPRAAELRRIIEELKNLQARLADKNNPLPAEDGKKLARTYEIKLQEAKVYQQEYENFRNEQEKAISRKEVAGMRISLNMIMEVTQKISKERDLDLVFDSSGDTNTGLPLLLYQKNSVDITDDVKAAIKDIKPATEEPKMEPKPANMP